MFAVSFYLASVLDGGAPFGSFFNNPDGFLFHAVTMVGQGSYITDISPEDTNLNKVVELVRDSDTLYCEAYFLHKDLERAFERHHLTAKLTGAIARKSGVRNLVLMHFSPKYFDNPDAIETEAMGEYNTPQEYAH